MPIDRAPGSEHGRLLGVRCGRWCRFGRGDFIVQAGDPAEVVYLVQRGQVRVFLLDEDGRETTTAVLGASHLVGLAPLLGRRRHLQEPHAFTQALTCVEAWALPLDTLVEAPPPEAQVLGGLLLGCLAQRVAIAQGLLRAVALLPVAERVADTDARLTACLAGSPPALNRVTLAGVVHARPETLARARSRRQVPTACPATPWSPGRRPAASGPPVTNATLVDETTAELHFRAGDEVVPADLAPGRVGLVLAGTLEMWLVGAGQRALVVDVAEPDDLVGVASLLGLPPVGLRARAIADGAVEFLSAGNLLRRLADEPTLARRLVDRLATRLERLERRLARLAATDARQRLIDVLRTTNNDHAPGRARSRRWSHAWLARQVGVRRETVTRTLAELERANIIRRQGRRILVLDPAGPRPAGAETERTRFAWLPLSQIDEPPPRQNSRHVYSDSSIDQLAASIREHGLLQPLCVRPAGGRYQLVFGVRRLRAAARAGVQAVPCTIQVTDDERAFLLNALENLHRQQLSGAERVRAIERLAASGLGVREISRRTGFNPSTISRWLRIDGRAELKAALEAGTLDIGRAAILAEAPRSALPELIRQAVSLSPEALRARVAALKLRQVVATTAGRQAAERRLREALRSLQAVRQADDRDLLVRLRRELDRLTHASTRPA